MMEQWNYLSQSSGIKGTIKEQIDDFIVEEEASHEDDSDGDHTIIRLTKYNMTTLDAIREISNILHISQRRIGYAGNKDKKAITTQYLSIQGVEPEDLSTLFVPGLEIDVICKNGPILLGMLDKNVFTIAIRNLNLPGDAIENRLQKIHGELDGVMPNYFGPQRFGTTRPITHVVGRELLKGNFEEAVWTYIAKPFKGESKRIHKVRKDLWDSRDPERAAERFPEQYRFEKVLLYHLASKPKDYIGAFKRLPNGLQSLFVHAYQSYVFNEALSKYVEDKDAETVDRDLELPLIGYKTQIRSGTLDEYMVEVMEEDGIGLKDFKLQELDHLASEGEYRKCFVPFHEFDVKETMEDELNVQKNAAIVQFSIGKGVYATSLLREFMKNR